MFINRHKDVNLIHLHHWLTMTDCVQYPLTPFHVSLAVCDVVVQRPSICSPNSSHASASPLLADMDCLYNDRRVGHRLTRTS
jgi:hypothetical protein